MSILRWLAVACLLAVAEPATARPFTVNDVLKLEGLGPGVIDPSGRWLIQEFEPAYDTAPRFDNDVNMRAIHAHLLRVDLWRPRQAQPAFGQSDRGGYIAGPFSPKGRFMVVHRNLDRHWEIGVLEVATRKVRWLGFGAEFADKGDTLAWRSETQLIALRMPPGDRYWKETVEQAAMQTLPALWRAATSGRASTAVIQGTGRFSDIHLPYPARQVVEVNVLTGQVRPFASGVFDQLALSPDGRSLALITAYGRVTLSGADLLSQGTQFRHYRLQRLDLPSGALTTPCAGEPLVSSLRWSPKGDEFLVYSRSIGGTWTDGAYQRIAADGVCRPLETAGVRPSVTIDADGAFTLVHDEWIGAAPMILGTVKGAARADWFALGPERAVNLTARLHDAPADPVLITPTGAMFMDKGRAVIVDQNGGARALADNAITKVLTPKRPNMSFPLPKDGARRSSTVFATSDADTGTDLLRISAGGVTPVVRLAAPPQQRVVTGGDAGLVTVSTDPHGAQTLWLHPPRGQSVALYRVNKRLRDVEFVSPHEIDHVGPGGQALKSWLYLPATSQGGRPPLLVMAYPGSSYDQAPFLGDTGFTPTVDDNVQLAVSRGYAVLVPSLPKPEGSADPGRGWDTQILRIVDAVKQTGLVDTDRLAFWGHSYGGYVALMLATETHRFRAIIASSPMSDLISVRGQGWPATWLTPYDDVAVQSTAGWSERGAQGHLMGTPWTARDRYIENSPVFFADRIRTPILMVQGDQDSSNIAQGREMFSDLGRLGKDSMLLTFYGEWHNIVSPPNVRLFVDKAFRFLDEALRSKPNPL